MTERENRLRAYRFQGPEWIPIAAGLPYLDWGSFGYDVRELESICLRHPILFPGFEPGTLARRHAEVPTLYPDLVAGRRYRDGWGCEWETLHTGMVGGVAVHPLDDWSAFEGLASPDPDREDGMRPLDWEALADGIRQAKSAGGFAACGLPHGHTFLRVQDLRGYVNLILDMADEEPKLARLLDQVTAFNLALVRRFIALSPDMITIAEDLGMQTSPMLSPEDFRRHIAPCYEILTRPIKDAGILVHEHSDGYVLPLLDDLIRTGGDVLNLQDLVNGIGNLAREAKGRVAIDLDIDRQDVTVRGTPGDIEDHIRQCVLALGSPAGGLSLVYQPWPPTPPANLDATFGAMERMCVEENPWR